MVKSASTAATASTGTGLSTPPSTSSRPFTMIGVITPGIATEARIATSTGPEVNQTSRRAPRSVATAVNGIGSSSMRAPSRISPIRASTRSSLIAPAPNGVASISRSTSRALRLVTQSVYCSSLPLASRPPIRAPIEVPAIPAIS